MGAGHGHHLHYHGHSPVHRLPAHVKLVALFSFVLVVVATPGTWHAAFLGYAALLALAVARTEVPVPYLARRMVVELPFLAFALLMPFVATGPRVQVGPLHLSEAGLQGAFTLLVKGTLGVVAALVLATTTEPRDLVTGLQRLRLPRQLVEIMSFMIRYLEVVTGDLQRMRIARESRGFQARSLRAWPALAATAGTVFIRSYERGERIHLAMLSRGYQGSIPSTSPTMSASRGQWALGAALPALALVILTTAALLRLQGAP